MSDHSQPQSTVAREHLKRLARLRQQIVSNQQCEAGEDRDGRKWAWRALHRFASGLDPKSSRISVEFARRTLGLVSRGVVK